MSRVENERETTCDSTLMDYLWHATERGGGEKKMWGIVHGWLHVIMSMLHFQCSIRAFIISYKSVGKHMTTHDQ